MSLVQISENTLLDFTVTLKKVAPLSRPKNDTELEIVRHWEHIASYVREIIEPLSHRPGFDADATYWAELSASYRSEVRDYEALHQDSSTD
jgi:hypothetical protein